MVLILEIIATVAIIGYIAYEIGKSAGKHILK